MAFTAFYHDKRQFCEYCEQNMPKVLFKATIDFVL